MRLVLAIRPLDIGGAERQFIELVKNIDKLKFNVTVCMMYGGAQEEVIKSIPNFIYYNLKKKGKYIFYKRYKEVLFKLKPDFIYSFLGEMNLFSLWCKPKYTNIIWGFRALIVDLIKYGKVSQIMFYLQKKLSYKVEKIITNSCANIEFHKKNGFSMEKSVIIHNGIDTDRFKKNEHERFSFKEIIKMNFFYLLDFYKLYYLLRVYIFYVLITHIVQNRQQRKIKFFSSSNNQLPSIGYIYASHGSFLIFTPTFFKYFDGFDKGTFLYCEEFILAERLREKDLKCWYEDSLNVLYKECQSTEKVVNNYKEKVKFTLEYTFNSCRIFAKIMKLGH